MYDASRWGALGESYEIVNGEYRFLPSVLTDEGLYDSLFARQTYGIDPQERFHSFTKFETLVATQSPEVGVYLEQIREMGAIDYADPVLLLTADEQEERNLMEVPLVDYAEEMFVRFIVGATDVADWDDYISELEAKGLREYEDLLNTAWQARQGGK